MTQIDAATIWLVVAGVSVVTYALRASFLLGIDRLDGVPPSIERVLPFVPTAVLAGLIAPNLFLVDGGVALGPGNEKLLAGAVAVVVARYTENMLATVAVGMAVLWALLWLG
ncbi:MAG: AzlD domain-containing protein [Haloferacaceae archaeon]